MERDFFTLAIMYFNQEKSKGYQLVSLGAERAAIHDAKECGGCSGSPRRAAGSSR
jgi:hypothetical protein